MRACRRRIPAARCCRPIRGFPGAATTSAARRWFAPGASACRAGARRKAVSGTRRWRPNSRSPLRIVINGRRVRLGLREHQRAAVSRMDVDIRRRPRRQRRPGRTAAPQRRPPASGPRPSRGAAPFNSPHDYPARGHRVQGAPCGRVRAIGYADTRPGGNAQGSWRLRERRTTMAGQPSPPGERRAAMEGCARWRT